MANLYLAGSEVAEVTAADGGQVFLWSQISRYDDVGLMEKHASVAWQIGVRRISVVGLR